MIIRFTSDCQTLNLFSAVSVAPSDSKDPVAEKNASPIRRSIHILVVMNGRDTVVPILMAGMAALKRWGGVLLSMHNCGEKLHV
jgi:hypothetical protein